MLILKLVLFFSVHITGLQLKFLSPLSLSWDQGAWLNMSGCFPTPESMTIRNGGTVVLHSSTSSAVFHPGCPRTDLLFQMPSGYEPNRVPLRYQAEGPFESITLPVVPGDILLVASVDSERHLHELDTCMELFANLPRRSALKRRLLRLDGCTHIRVAIGTVGFLSDPSGDSASLASSPPTLYYPLDSDSTEVGMRMDPPYYASFLSNEDLYTDSPISYYTPVIPSNHLSASWQTVQDSSSPPSSRKRKVRWSYYSSQDDSFVEDRY